MKSWFTAAEIAALQLPGVPTTKRTLNRFARQQGWLDRAELVRPRAGNGGGLEFHLDALPPAARSAYVARHVPAIEIPASIAREAAGEPAAENLTGAATDARDARLALLVTAERFAAAAGVLRKRADRQFCDVYNAGARAAAEGGVANGAALQIASWIRAEVKSLTPRTLARWRALRKAGKLSSLAVDRAAARRGTGVLDTANDGAVKTYILALLAKQPQLTAHHIRSLVADRFSPGLSVGLAAIPVPPIRTFQYALKAWRHEYRNELLLVRDPDGFKSRARFAARNLHPAARVNELWQIDASPADVMTTDGRHSLYLCEDIYSRRLVGLVSKTARAQAVGLLVRKAIIAWGVPECVQTDRGADFVARETQRLFAALGVEHAMTAPFSPEKKGHVERAIGTLQRGLMRTLPGFIGHSVADRKVIEGRKAFAARLGESPEDTFQVELTAADLQARVDEWCEQVYGTAPHAGLKGMTPFAAAATFAGQLRRIEDVRALDMLLAAVAGKNGLRTVTKSGIRIGHSHYLGGFLEVGATVLVRMDPGDLGRAYVFTEDGARFLGEAISPDLAGIDPQQAIRAVRAEQKRIISERLEGARRETRRIKAGDFAGAIARQAAKDAGKLVEFPRAILSSDDRAGRSPERLASAVVPHDTPELAAARDAQRGAPEPSFSDDVRALHAEMMAEASRTALVDASATRVTKLREQETAHHRYRRACALEGALARGEEATAGDLLWLGGYREGSEYRAFRKTYGADHHDETTQRSTS
ncbi:MAG: DDE-type integrase/transposase/recombinase [Xanthobacteraceae bacterium]